MFSFRSVVDSTPAEHAVVRRARFSGGDAARGGRAGRSKSSGANDRRRLLPPLHPDVDRDPEEQQHEALGQPLLARAPDRPHRVGEGESGDHRVAGQLGPREQLALAAEQDELRRRRVRVGDQRHPGREQDDVGEAVREAGVPVVEHEPAHEHRRDDEPEDRRSPLAVDAGERPREEPVVRRRHRDAGGQHDPAVERAERRGHRDEGDPLAPAETQERPAPDRVRRVGERAPTSRPVRPARERR